MEEQTYPVEDLSALQDQVRQFLKDNNNRIVKDGDVIYDNEDDNVDADDDVVVQQQQVLDTSLSSEDNNNNNTTDDDIAQLSKRSNRRKFVMPIQISGGSGHGSIGAELSTMNTSSSSGKSSLSGGSNISPRSAASPNSKTPPTSSYPMSPGSPSPAAFNSPSSTGHSIHHFNIHSPGLMPLDDLKGTLGQYQLLHHIGNGYLGNTFSAIPPDSSEEYEILRSLAINQNIVNYTGLVTDQHNRVAIVQEFVDNGSFADIYKRLGPFPEAILARYVTQVLETLHYLHQQEIIHRNLKANNLLLARGGRCKLSDFGVGCTLGNSYRTALLGEPYWMAPELLMMRDFNSKIDIWSLGCTVIELLTGKPPFYNLSPMEALVNIVDERKPIDLPKDISKELTSFLQSCLVRVPSQRSSAEQLIKHPWLVAAASANSSSTDSFLAMMGQTPMAKPVGATAAATSSFNLSSDAIKPRSENFSVDLFSQIEKNEQDIGAMTPMPNNIVNAQSIEVQHYTTHMDKGLAPPAQVEQLQKIIDYNHSITTFLKEAVSQLESEQTNGYSLQVQMKAKMQEILDQNKTSARVSAHSNSLLKRTNQMASELTKKNEHFKMNIKRLEDYLLTKDKDDCAKKLASVVYKHKISFENLLNPTLAAPVVYQLGSKVWKKGQEKKALGTLKDSFLFLFKNDKSKEPLDVVYLNDKKSISVSSSMSDSSKKKSFYISIGTSITGEAELTTDVPQGVATAPSTGAPTSSSATATTAAGAAATKESTLWCILAFENQKDMEAWYGVLEASIPWYERKPNEISKPKGLVDAKKHQKQKSVDRSVNETWRNTSSGMKAAPFPGVFGIKLEDVMARENPNSEIPSFVTKMVNFLERNIQEEGILRISGSTTEIQEMRATLQKGDNIDYKVAHRDPNAVAGLLKLYLRELPDNLVPMNLRIMSAEIIGDRSVSDDDRVARVVELFKQLPKHELNLLKHMIRFAKRVVEQSDLNKMVLVNVTTCFAQSLKGLIPGLFAFCVQHYEAVFVTPYVGLGTSATGQSK
ncbi:hypothetical protein SAMD00019534_065510 [Acytostelium subglobosum LB1]|uniref:hypothetical protein n=1 Tax=Acytostelium subglobosum LB1 TaxID=1410327 RepID=UPI0006448430|nr:hypothetical protein SAMD00019534_065510 [Acytostelium subglobosum LB1]GAM23376.1 hypothetical protein SAMD00019534_065510 [Acytostelium subglobosum LB1]|eukprot:XP_012753825.1 hypothetical protein SAMD00019534_065510 [Acytostelium subglobosum LB1]